MPSRSRAGEVAPAIPEPAGLEETAWVEVIAKMEEVYSDLLRYEVELERKNAELEDAQRFITSVLSSMSDVLIVCDRAGRVLQVNAAVCALTGLGEDALIGRGLEDVLASPEDGGAVAISETGETEARLRTEAGASDLLSFTCAVRRDRRGRQAGVVLMGRPIGELKRAYAALAEAHAELKQSQQHILYTEKMASLGRLVAGVAHELNNPISFVYANVHTLVRYGDKRRRYLDAVHGGGDAAAAEALRSELRVDALLDDLEPLTEGALEGAERVRDIVKGLRRLSFSGDEATTDIDLREIARSAVTWAQRGLKSDIDVVFDLDEPLMVRGRASQLHQVALNIVQNAFDAMKATTAPRLEVAGRREAGEIVLVLRDHGPGIADSDLAKIFEPFFTTKEIGEGTGLGLWVSFDIVKAHGGDLRASNHPGGGGVFALHLPALE
ncbi:MAG: ATP-binding protein [Caulobacterales bacterium]|nr:ATP-binding protein [Caulobacterales bacterium]